VVVDRHAAARYKIIEPAAVMIDHGSLKLPWFALFLHHAV
jgi:hypothetical protein